MAIDGSAADFVTLRPAIAVDARWLFDLHEATMRERVEAGGRLWNQESQLRSFRARPESDVRIVCWDGNPVGSVHLTRDPDGSLRLGLIEVDPAFQGNGIGSVVLSALRREAGVLGVDVTLRVNRDNRAANLYSRLGFERDYEDDTHVHMRLRTDSGETRPHAVGSVIVVRTVTEGQIRRAAPAVVVQDDEWIVYYEPNLAENMVTRGAATQCRLGANVSLRCAPNCTGVGSSSFQRCLGGEALAH